MSNMATPKRKKAEPEPKPRRRRPVLQITMPEDVEAGLTAYIAAQDAPPDRTAVGLAALKAFLSARGFWPPPAGK